MASSPMTQSCENPNGITLTLELGPMQTLLKMWAGENTSSFVRLAMPRNPVARLSVHVNLVGIRYKRLRGEVWDLFF